MKQHLQISQAVFILQIACLFVRGGTNHFELKKYMWNVTVRFGIGEKY